jgi:hypothetical protein
MLALDIVAHARVLSKVELDVYRNNTTLYCTLIKHIALQFTFILYNILMYEFLSSTFRW